MSWSIAQAKQKFSEVVRLSAEEPQVIYNRGRPVAAVVAADALATLAERRPSTLADEVAELRRLAAEEAYELKVPARAAVGRPNAFAKNLKAPAKKR